MKPLTIRYIRDFQDFWACQRPLTSHWGSGQVWERICKVMGTPDAVFGKTDGIPEKGEATVIDKNTGYDWIKLPFNDNQFEFGYWDPPYEDRLKNGYRKTMMFKKEGQEIWRTCKRIAILHSHMWPWAWLDAVAPTEREHLIAVSMGPLKEMRALQVFRKKDVNQSCLTDDLLNTSGNGRL